MSDPKITRINELRIRNHPENVVRWGHLGTWEFSVDRNCCEIDQDFIERYGYSIDDFTSDYFKNWCEKIHPDDQETFKNSILDLVAGKVREVDQIYRFQKKNGGWVWFHSKGGIQERDPSGRVSLVGGIVLDITSYKDTEDTIKRRDKLLTVSNEIGRMLLDASVDDFVNLIWDAMDKLGKAAEVDRVYIWENHPEHDGEIPSTQLFEWSLGAEPQQGNEFTVDVPLGSLWREILSSGKCINSKVRDLPYFERNHLEGQDIRSVLVAPIIFNGEFWGFVGYDDCKNERTWHESEEAILHSTAMMLTAAIKRHATEKALATEQKTLMRIFESSPIGVVISNNGKVLRCNTRFVDLCQVNVSETLPTMFIDDSEYDNILEEVARTGFIFNRNVQLKLSDDSIKDILLTIRTIDYEGEPAYLSWLVDITDLKQTEKELLLARDLAEAGTRAKSEFLARMSHEIRTPMNAIHGMIYLCLQTELTEKQKDYLYKTQTATMNLLGIIDDVLDFSKIEAGRMELEKIRFNLTDIVQETVDIIEFQAQEKHLELAVHIGEKVHEYLLGDPTRLRQIMTNLAGNAIKFTDKGKIELSVDLADNINIETLPPNETVLLFKVSDTGIGLTPEQIEHIFESFSQADGSTTRKYGGTGLGLVISKNLIELMGGKIELESVFGKGTTFSFTARFQKTDPIFVESVDAFFSDKKILVVDDDSITRELIREILLSFGMKVETAENGIEGIESLVHAKKHDDPFDIALIDWKMPRMDGIETIRQIRLSEDIEVPPQILMISAYDRYECLRQSRNLGIAGFLVKPITSKSLHETLATVLSNELRKRREPFEEPGVDISGTRVLLVEDNKVNQIVAVELLKMHGVEPVIANNGLEALEAVKNEDFDLVLMDVQMPVMDGLEATVAIRSLDKPGIDKLPILAMTANAMDSDYRKSIEVGMNDHLTKPIDPEKLRRALEIWVPR